MGFHVLSPFDPRFSPGAVYVSSGAATAYPGVPNPSQASGCKISVRLLQAHGAEAESVQLHDENDTP